MLPAVCLCCCVLQEAHNLAEFAHAHSYLGFVDTPDLIWQLTTRRWLGAGHKGEGECAVSAHGATISQYTPLLYIRNGLKAKLGSAGVQPMTHRP